MTPKLRPDLIYFPEILDILGCSPDQLEAHLESGRLPRPAKLPPAAAGNRLIAWTPEDITKFRSLS